MSTDPYAAPTDEEWAAIDERWQEADRIWQAAYDVYMIAFRTFEKAHEKQHEELHYWIRMKALRTPVRDYVVDELTHLIDPRPPTAKKIDPHHRPADVQQVLDDLLTEGKVRKIGKGYEWVRS
jgi:hypothetical protein